MRRKKKEKIIIKKKIKKIESNNGHESNTYITVNNVYIHKI